MRNALIWLTCCVVLGGCATASYKQAAVTTTRMEEAGASLTRAGREIDDTVAALNSLKGKNGIDLRNQYKVFVRRLDAMETQRRQVAARQSRLEAASKSYFAAWDSDLKRFRSSDLRKKSRQRRQAAIDSFNRMFDALQIEEEAYSTIMADMKDIRRYLGYELSPQSVDSLKDEVQKVNSDAAAVHQKIDQAVKELQGTQTPLPSDNPPPAPAQPS